jgi:hypothetical protein
MGWYAKHFFMKKDMIYVHVSGWKWSPVMDSCEYDNIGGTYWLAERLSVSQELLEHIEGPTADPEQSNWTSTFQLQVSASLPHHYGSQGRYGSKQTAVGPSATWVHSWSSLPVTAGVYEGWRRPSLGNLGTWHNEYLDGLQCSPNPVKEAKSERLQWAGHVIPKTRHEHRIVAET